MRRKYDAETDLDAILVYVAASMLPDRDRCRLQLGLYYLAACAARAGFRVKVDSLTTNDLVASRLNRLIRRHRCRVVGFYVDNDNQWELSRIIPELKRSHPDIDVIIGGPQVTAEPEQALRRLRGAVCGAIGEGEDTFAELLAMPVRTARRLRECRGLVYRSGSRLRRSEPRQPVAELESLPDPDIRQLTLGTPSGLIPAMITGRGCRGRCAFCYEGSAHRHGKRLRLLSAERCIDRFDHLAKTFSGQYIVILDNTFIEDPRRTEMFCRGVIARHGDRVKWFCEARPDTLANHPDLLPLMVAAGLLRAQIGGESGCQRVLDAYRKDVTLDQIRRCAELAKRNGLLSMYVNFIVGGAWETAETCAMTLRFALELVDAAPGCVAVGKSFYTCHAGTPMFEHPERFGIVVCDPDGVTAVGNAHVTCRTLALSRTEILSLGREFETAVGQKTAKLARLLPWKTVARHMQAWHEWCVSTEWYQALAADGWLVRYFDALYAGRAHTLDRIARSDLGKAKPIRTTAVSPTGDDACIARAFAGRCLELDAASSLLLELASGKLSLDDICLILKEGHNHEDAEVLRRRVVDRYAALEAEHLVLWRTAR